MKSKDAIRLAGKVGMLSAAMWLAALFIEYRYGLQPPGDGSTLFYVDQIFFTLALAGYVILLFGYWRSGPAGEGRFGRISLGIFIGGLLSLLVAGGVQLATRNPDFFLFPVGGILQLLGGLLTGIAVVITGKWKGWQRFAPLVQGLYYLIVLFVPIAVANQSPTQLTESLWQVAWFFSSLALFTA